MANQALARMLGYDSPDDLATAVTDIGTQVYVAPEQRAEILSRLTNQDAMLDFECECQRKDGTRIWLRQDSRAVRDESGTVVYFEGFIQDITDRKQAQALLRESEARLQMILENMPVMLDAFDERGVLVAWNHECERVTGYTADEMVGNQRTMEILYPDRDYRERMLREWTKRGGDYYRWEWELTCKDGSVRSIAWSNISSQIPVPGWATWGIGSDVTDRKREEAERRLGEFALSRASVASYLIDPDARILRVNQANCEMLGYTEEELTRMTVHDVNPAFPAEVWPAHWRELRANKQMRFESILRHKDGHTFPVEIEINYLAFEGREYNFAFARDITERKQAEAALQHERDRLQQVLDTHFGFVCILTLDGFVLEANQAPLTLMGLSRADVLGRRFWEIGWLEPGTELQVQSDVEAAARGEVVRGNVTAHFPGLGARIVDAVFHPLRDDTGNVINVVGFGVDITERHQVERGLRLFRALVDRTTDGIEVIDVETGRFLDVNEKACIAHGYTREEYLRLSVPEVDPVVATRPWGELIQERRLSESTIFESQHRRKDGSIFPVEVNLNFIQLDREYLVANVRDVTERKRLEEQLRQSQKMEAIGRLAGGVAHDFNNMLTVINGFAELLLADLSATDPRRDPLDAILDAGERAAGLTNQLLAFSRKAIIEPKYLDLNQAVESAIRMLRRLIGADVRFVTNMDSNLAMVKIDPVQLEQLILNLAVNARDAMPQGGLLTISTTNVPMPAGSLADPGEFLSGYYVQLTVSDTGEGMSEEIKTQIFEPFFTTKEVGKGTGLGLATVYGIVSQAGGAISVESEVGKGTSFQILLPAVNRPDAVGNTGLNRVPLRGNETILLAEDEEGVRRLARLALEMHGYTVLEAGSGAAAVRVAASHSGQIHLLVTDVVMPDGGGRQLTDTIRAIRPRVAVLYMSGYMDDAVVRHGIETSTDAFLQKPFTPTTLARKVRDVIDAARG